MCRGEVREDGGGGSKNREEPSAPLEGGGYVVSMTGELTRPREPEVEGEEESDWACGRL